MANPHLQEAVDLVQRAIQHDNNHQYHEAQALYEASLRKLNDALLFEPNPNVQNTIRDKVREYSARVATIKEALSRDPSYRPHASQPAPGAVPLYPPSSSTHLYPPAPQSAPAPSQPRWDYGAAAQATQSYQPPPNPTPSYPSPGAHHSPHQPYYPQPPATYPPPPQFYPQPYPQAYPQAAPPPQPYGYEAYPAQSYPGVPPGPVYVVPAPGQPSSHSSSGSHIPAPPSDSSSKNDYRGVPVSREIVQNSRNPLRPGTIFLRARLDSDIVRPGNNVRIELEVENTTSSKIDTVKVGLLRRDPRIVSGRTGKIPKDKIGEMDSCPDNKFPMREGRYVGSVVYQIPHVSPSSAGNWTYELYVRLNTGVGQKDPRVKLPIRVLA